MTVTPMMAQWHECKNKAKEALVFFRLGDFYEAFYEDAKLVSKEMGLTLTARQGIPMCGVPFHTAENYIDKLIAKGYKIAVAEQIEDPKAAKGLVKREIVRIITPGTIINSQLLSEKKNNYFVSIADSGKNFGLAVLDLTTTEFRVVELGDESALVDELCKLKPRELLVSKNFPFLKELSYSFSFLANVKESMNPKLAHDLIISHFKVQTLDGFGLTQKWSAILAVSALLFHLKEELQIPIDHIISMRSDSLSQFMAIDRSTMQNLQLNDTFFDLLDETATPMGGRLLRNWIQYPLLSCSKINERQKEVQIYIDRWHESLQIKEHLAHVRDLERLMMKIVSRNATPRDCLALGVSLSHIAPIRTLVREPLFDTEPLAKLICSAMHDFPPLRIGEGDIFKDGYHEELDHLRQMGRESSSYLAQYQMTLREQTGIKTLKVGYTKAFGYYIEVTHAQAEKIPRDFFRRQTLTNGERFITEELKQFESQILSAEERAKGLEAQLFETLRLEILTQLTNIQELAKQIAVIDVYLAMAAVAKRNQWVKPIVNDGTEIEIIEGRHPIVEKALGPNAFIPNDTMFNDQQQLLLITGPNMAGKSTYIRQVALLVILAQMGSFIPAKSARIGIVDKVFSRIGASDDLARGQSTFMVEMAETANILNNATSKSLVLLDEIGRGTSTYDGISIAWAVAEYLLSEPGKKAKTLFATHYWELTELEKRFKGASNYQTAIAETENGIIFLRKIIKGAANKSYGIHVAKLAGLPRKVIARAEEMLRLLEKKPKKNEQLLLF